VAWLRHTFWMALRLVGLRDRLRCPSCHAVGTWKPHGGWLDREDERRTRRWLCKWCGYYVGPEGTRLASLLDPGPWRLDGQGTTPERVVKDSEIPSAWPWRG
jgi:hypothetical protein